MRLEEGDCTEVGLRGWLKLPRAARGRSGVIRVGSALDLAAKSWCPGPDSNRHALRRRILSPLCLANFTTRAGCFDSSACPLRKLRVARSKPIRSEPAQHSARGHANLRCVSPYRTASRDSLCNVFKRRNIGIPGIAPLVGRSLGVAIRAEQTQVQQLIVEVVAIDVIELERNGLRPPFPAPAPRALSLHQAFADQPVLELSGLNELIEDENLFDGGCWTPRVHGAKPVPLLGPVGRIQSQFANAPLDLLITAACDTKTQLAQDSGR